MFFFKYIVFISFANNFSTGNPASVFKHRTFSYSIVELIGVPGRSFFFFFLISARKPVRKRKSLRLNNGFICFFCFFCFFFHFNSVENNRGNLKYSDNINISLVQTWTNYQSTLAVSELFIRRL